MRKHVRLSLPRSPPKTQIWTWKKTRFWDSPWAFLHISVETSAGISCKHDSCMLAVMQLAFGVLCSFPCDGSLLCSLPRFLYANWILLRGRFQFWAIFSSQHSAGNYHCNANTWQSELKCTSSVVKTHFQDIDDPCNQGIFLSMGPYYIALYDAVGELG